MIAYGAGTAAIEVVPTGFALGAEIRGIDARKPVPPETAKTLREAWKQHLVLLFRGQTGLTDQQLITFTQVFGPLQAAPNSDVTAGFGSFADVPPEVAVISNIKVDGRPIGALGAGEADWHTDMSFIEEPPAGSCLYAIEVPASGGNTSFINMHRALDTLDEEMADAVNGVQCVHDLSLTSTGSRRQGVAEVADVREAPGARHPVLRTHPDTKRKALFLGRRRNAWLVGFEVEDSERLLDCLWAHATDEAHVWEHRWREGDIVLWDNRAVMHRRDAFDPATRRLMHRTQVKGGRPR
ncbi:MAG: TauD/TfdA family dioxygenase [Alphaproteobacteria bacterium]|nr:TauD/TfdA family dioxygenase [Alphaproteobacteria bacterium]